MFSAKILGSGIATLALLGALTRVNWAMIESPPISATGVMVPQLKAIDGVVGAPGVSWASETTTGLFRNGASDVRMSIGGSSKTFWNAAGLGVGAVNPTTSTSTPFTVTGAGPLFAVESRSGVNTRLASNSYFDGANDKYNVTGFAGIVELPGATNAQFAVYTAPSGTGGNNATFTARLLVNESGVTIGATGTAMSASYRGTVVWDPAATTNAQRTNTITLTGAVAGADCIVTPPASIATPFAIAPFCYVTLNTCNIGFWSIGTNDLPSDTWACRVINP